MQQEGLDPKGVEDKENNPERRFDFKDYGGSFRHSIPLEIVTTQITHF
jgi:hypothetical protein